MEESKATFQEPVNGAVTVLKGLAIMAGSVLAIIAGIISPFGEAMFFGISVFVGIKEKKRLNKRV